MLLRCSRDFNLECIVDNVANIINETNISVNNDVPVILFGISEMREYDITINSAYRFEGGDIGDYQIVYSHPPIFDVDLVDNSKTIIIGLHRDIREDVAEATRLVLYLLSDLVYKSELAIVLSNDLFPIDQEVDELEDISSKNPETIIKLEYPPQRNIDQILYLSIGSFLTLSMLGILLIFFFLLSSF